MDAKLSSRSPARQIAVLVETDDLWGRNIVEGVCAFGNQNRWRLLIAPRDRHGRLRIPRIWEGQGVIASLRNRALQQHLKRLNVPIVDVSSTLPAEPWFGRVQTDDRERAAMAVEHLLGKGLRNFACYAPAIGRYSDARAQEFRLGIEAAGYECAMFDKPAEREADWLTDYQRVQQWLSKLPKPVGIFAGDPHPARQLIEVCTMNEIRVPDDVSILAGDEDFLCNVVSPQISSIELASHQIGQTAAGLLHGLMNGEPSSDQPVLIPPLRIRPRQSTDLLAIDDEELAAALRFIREHVSEGIDVADVARACHVSRRSLEQRFRKGLNRSPGEEIRRVRLENVRRLLLDTNRPIDLIARESGFAGAASLSQAFQKHFGMPPSALRRSNTTE
ncbi:xylose operon transcription regulator XylR [Rubinisphaera sp. JC750]|uniref:AraC family transcriptional regulator n=1 Tax=Rubinisphaera sp. JC750 TaxID=2898658 RepID=UPI001F3DE673|nr:xylose operon transcription regulator XylR [Rubinisphaera sp. JC750]